MCELPNTSNNHHYATWLDRQEALITSLEIQPLLVVLRFQKSDMELSLCDTSLFSSIKKLNRLGIRHIEIAWSPHPQWIPLMENLFGSFSNINFGIASVTNSEGLQSVLKLGVSYAMSPVWDPILQYKARECGQVLVPGVFSPTEINQASNFGYRILKLYPASILGIEYLNQIEPALGYSLPFFIAAGGLKITDLHPWLKAGVGAISLGRELMKHEQLSVALANWLRTYKASKDKHLK